jgi:flagellar biosynthesis GTPase FlhF
VLGRNCQPNAYTNAKPIPSTTGLGEVLKDIALETLTAAMPPGDVLALVQKNAGSGSGSAANLSRGSADAVHSASTDNGAKPEGYGDVPTQPDSQQANAGTPANAADANAAKPKSQQDKNKQDKKKQAADKKKHDQQAKQLADQQKKQQAEQQKKQQQKQQKEQQEQQKKAAEAARKQAQGDAPQGY